MVGYERHGALVVCVIFVLSVTAFQPIGAEQAATSTEQGSHSNNPVNLDLTSTTRNLAAPNFVQNGPVAIEVGGVTRSIDSASVLTPAERLATWQVFSTGQQSIQLGSSGNATGGSFTMGAKFSQYVNSLVIPQGVTAVRDFGTASVLNLSGNLTNAGSLFAVSSNAAVTNAVINANNIINKPGALLSSILPVGALPGISSTVSNLSLTINALQNIINAGTISSAGSLTATAGGSIINSLPAGIVGPNPIMQAINNVGINASSILNSGIVTAHTGDVNITAVTTAANSNQLLNSLATAQIINQGAIASLTGNINIAKSISGQLVSELTQDLAINNSGGLMEAINGNIAINSPGFLVLHNTDGALNAQNNVAISSLPPLSHSSSRQTTITVTGGHISGSNIDLLAPDNVVKVNADQLTGTVNIKACATELHVERGDLIVGTMDLSGDPIYTNATGNLILTNNFVSGIWNTNGESFIALAGGNLSIAGGATGTLNATGTSTSPSTIVLGAGVSFNASNSITGASGQGGDISFSGVNLTNNQGSVQLTAYGPSPQTSSPAGKGHIAVANIDTSDQIGTGGGTVSVVADGNVSLGSITTNGMTGGCGGAGSNGTNGSTAGNIEFTWNGSGTFSVGKRNRWQRRNRRRWHNRKHWYCSATGCTPSTILGISAGTGGYGGLGGNGGGGSTGGGGGNAGNGGNVVITSNSTGAMTVGDTSLEGGCGGVGGDGGSGGVGGAGGTGGGYGGCGGTGGPGGTGGGGGSGGTGGVGGNITITSSSTGSIVLGTSSAGGGSGGKGGGGGTGGKGGDGGPGGFGGAGAAGNGSGGGTGGSGGNGGVGGSGSQGGNVSIISKSTGTVKLGDTLLDGGSGGSGGVGGRGGPGGGGGGGGGCALFGSGGNGGCGGSGGSGGNGNQGGIGGEGGSLSVVTYGDLDLGKVSFGGGAGGTGGDGGAGGIGCGAAIGYSGCNGATGGALTSGNGGTGGQGGSGGCGSNGGVGGDAGSLNINVSSLRITPSGASSNLQAVISGAGGAGGGGGCGGSGVDGGTGGDGGSGGDGGGCGGKGGSGGSGGRAGSGSGGGQGATISVSAKSAKLTARQEMTSAIYVAGGAGGTGGNGGGGGWGNRGGLGGTGLASGCGGKGGAGGCGGAGAAAGSGGDGGTVSLATRDLLSVDGDVVVSGGSGGDGGDGSAAGGGGTGGDGGCGIFRGGCGGVGGGGGNGGNGIAGGSGGNAGNISLTSTIGDIKINAGSQSGAAAGGSTGAGSLYAQGGIGGSGGCGGAGGSGGGGGTSGMRFGLQYDFSFFASDKYVVDFTVDADAEVEVTVGTVGAAGGQGGFGGTLGYAGYAGNGGNIKVLAPAGNVTVNGNISATGASAGNYGNDGIQGMNGPAGATQTFYGIGLDADFSLTPDSFLPIKWQPPPPTFAVPNGPTFGLGPVITDGNTTTGLVINFTVKSLLVNHSPSGFSVFNYTTNSEGQVTQDFSATLDKTGVSESFVQNGQLTEGVDASVSGILASLATIVPAGAENAYTGNIATGPIVDNAFLQTSSTISQGTYNTGVSIFKNVSGGSFNQSSSVSLNNVIAAPGSNANVQALTYGSNGGANLQGGAPTTPSFVTSIIVNSMTSANGGMITVVAGKQLTIGGTVSNVGGTATDQYSIHFANQSLGSSFSPAPVGAGGSVLLDAGSITINGTGAPTASSVNPNITSNLTAVVNVGSITFITRPVKVPLLIKPLNFGGATWNSTIKNGNGLNIADGNGLVLASNPIYLIQNQQADITLDSLQSSGGSNANYLTFLTQAGTLPSGVTASSTVAGDIVVLAAGNVTAQNTTTTSSFTTNLMANVLQQPNVQPAQLIVAAGDAAASLDYNSQQNTWLITGGSSSTGGTVYLPNQTLSSAQLTYVSAAPLSQDSPVTASSPGHVRVSSLTSQGAVHASAAGNLIASSGISAPYVDLSSVGSTSGLQASAKGSTPGLALQANWFRLQHLNGAIVDVSPFGASSTNEVVLVAGLGSYLSVSNAAGKLTLAGDLSANHLILSAQTLNIEGTIHGLKSGDVFSTIALSSDTGLILADSPTNAGVLTVKTKGSLLLQNLTASDQISLVAQDSIIAHNLITPFLAAFTQGDINITVPFQIDAQVVAGSKGNVNITSAGGLTLGGHAGIPTYGKNITVTAFGSLTAQGPVVAFGDLRMSSSDLLNNSGTITLNSLVSSAGNATIAATTLTQTGGLLRAGNGLTLNVSGDIGTTDRPVITDIPSVSFPYSATGQQGNVYMLNLGTASSVTINPSGLSSSLAFNGANFLFDAVGSNIVVKGDITTGLSDAITLASAGGYSINLYGNLTSPAINLVALSSQAGNGGAIVQNSGSIITNQLNLIVGSGGAYSIASNQAIALGPMSGSTNVNVLAQSAGSVFLNSTTPLSSITLTGIGLTNSNSTFFAAAQGDILTTAIVTASSIQLASVSGNIGSAGTAANLNSSSSTSTGSHRI